MDRRGQSTRPSKGQGSRPPPNYPDWRTDPRHKNTSDDDTQYARITSKASPTTRSGGNNQAGRKQTRDEVGPPIHRTSSAPSSSSSSSMPRPGASSPNLTGHAASKRYLPMSSSSDHPTAQRGPPGAHSRSNPTAPVWGAGPSQPRGELNPRSPPNRDVPHATAPYLARAPGRKATSGAPPMWDPANEPQSISVGRMNPTPPKKRIPIEVNKSTNLPVPFWQHQDAEYEARQKVERRMNKLGDLSRHTPFKQTVTPPRRSYLSPTLQVFQDPPPDSGSDTDGSPMDVDAPPPQQARVAKKTVQPQQSRGSILANLKAARKKKWTQPRQPPEDTSESSVSSGGETHPSKSVLELTDSSSAPDKEVKAKETVERDPVSENEIIIVEPPQPLITISLPQITPATTQPQIPPQGPPDALVAALEEICLSPVRMRKAKRLPFLRKNLRRGFRIRCNAIGIRTSRARPGMPVFVRYEYTELIYETQVLQWLCPLCELHGAFPNGNVLRLHIQWDHAEVILERWEQRTSKQGKPEWRIQLLIPEITYERLKPKTYDFIKTEPEEVPMDARISPPPNRERSMTVPPVRAPSPIRPVSQAPATRSQERETEPPGIRDVAPTPEPDLLRQVENVEIVAPKPQYSDWQEYAAGRARRPSTTSSLPGLSRSAISSATEPTETGTSPSTVRAERTPVPRGGLYPSPPPPEDPLGPAAKFPYLPAKSEYDGPDIYYSCRPGGPSTFDLLGTLPMEPFGVLEWDILDREEEIYESDDVRVEYKVMHALWLRWITLNRTLFIRDYYKGILAFIDMYWRMIHQAAGWRAMRFWLLALLTHRYLTGHQVAKALRHYEDLVGMAHW